MGKFAKLVDTEEKIVEFKKRYGIPEDVHIRYVPYGDLALVLNQDLVLPMVAIIEGGVRIPMHTFLLQFLAHFRLAPLQCAPNVFRIVMGTAVLMEKLGLDLTVHDITYVYSLQATGRDQYTLFARNAYRKLVTGLPDSSKGRDEDFLVFTGNWQNPHINCSLRPGVPDKEFTAKKVELVERRTVEHLLQKPCFIDSGGRPRAASVLLDYVPSYKSFQKDSSPTSNPYSTTGLDPADQLRRFLVELNRLELASQLVFVIKLTGWGFRSGATPRWPLPVLAEPEEEVVVIVVVDGVVEMGGNEGKESQFTFLSAIVRILESSKEEVSVVRPGKDQEDIIQAVPLTARKGVQVPRLVPPLSDPNFIPSIESSEAGLPIIRFPSIFDPDPNPTEEMPVQPRTVSIADVLGTSAPETSRTSLSASPLPLPPGFSQGEGVMRKKRKRGTAQDDEGCVQEGSSPPQPSKAKSPKKAKSKNNRALQKATGQIPQGRVGQDDLQQPWSCSFLLENRSVDKGDSVLKSGRGVRGGQVAEAVGKALLLPEDMKVWQEKRSKYMLENLKRDSILAVQGIFEAGNRLLETERRLNLSTDEIKRLKDLESSASVRIRAAESAQKSAEAGLLNLQNQVAELQRKLDTEHKSASQVRIENSQLKEALAEAEVRADKGAQAYYDQGVNQASQDLRYQLRGECNKYFVQGWHQALDNAGVDDDSDLYDLAYSRQPYEVPVSEEGNELEAGEGVAGDPTVLGSPEALSEPVLVDDTKAAEDRPDDQIPAAESQEGEEGSDVDETIDVVD
uniref:Transposase (putative) gypsy type domain-containing protein n=1 Tax=Fagus sylvatica TaxID=28930 RepID=A0A2N9HSA5_FAGSY